MTFLKSISKKYKIVSDNIADKLHKYSDDIWELLSNWYYHTSFETEMGDVDAKDLEPALVSDLKQKYKVDDGNKAVDKCVEFHNKRSAEIDKEIQKKYPEVSPWEAVIESNLCDKFEKWKYSKNVYNPSGEPKTKYLDH